MTVTFKQLFLWLAVISAFELIGCAAPDKPQPGISVEEQRAEIFAQQQQDDIAGGALPNSALTPQLLYRILASDIAITDGKTEQGAAAWLALAKETQDARAAKRAALVAFYANHFELAYDATRLWITLAPKSLAARQLMVAVLLKKQAVRDIIPHVQMILRAKPEQTADFFIKAHLLWGPYFNLADVVSTTETLTKDSLHLPEAKVALAYARQINGQRAEALGLLDAALKQKPSLLAAKNLRQAIQNNPTSGVLPLNAANYRQVLQRAKNAVSLNGDIATVNQIYQHLLAADAGNIEVRYDYGLWAWQQGKLAVAIAQLTEVEARHPAYVEQVRLTLGQVTEQAGDFKQAQQWYRRVQGELKREAQRAQIICLVKAEQVSEALALLRSLPVRSEAQKIQYAQLHAQIYYVRAQFERAKAILTRAIRTFPRASGLYYDRAIVFERLQQFVQSEADLRRAISIAPDDPTLLNGLGFILTEQNKNLAEAEALLSRARSLAPDTLYIEDSWGWLLYRQGKLAEAEKVFTPLFFMHKEPTVIAHLGEILWVQKKYRDARAVFAAGKEAYPDDQTLQRTIKRLGIE